MLSIAEIIQKVSSFDYFDFRAEYRINRQLRYFDIQSIDQIFMGEPVSIKRAIHEKMALQWLLDIGEDLGDHFLSMASVAMSWKPKENECYIGFLWIEPDFRGNGLASFIFNEIINYADTLGIVLTLHAIPFINPDHKPTHQDILRLIDYYGRFGFKKLYSSGISIGRAMKRFPRKNNE